MKKILITIGAIAIIAVGWLLFSDETESEMEVDPSISSFSECLEAGYPQLDSDPPACETPDGKRFVEKLPEAELESVTRLATISGELTCLSHWDTSGQQTLECAIGLESDAGDYYTLANLSDELDDLATGRRVTLSGRLIPGSAERYQSVGRLEVEEAVVWSEHTDPESGVTFAYPEAPGSRYLEFVDWPPQVRVLDEPFSCNEAGEATARAGETTLRTIDGADYCVTSRAEGAAGSTYMQYAYLTERAGETVSLTFSTRSPRCTNFATDSEREQCESAQHLDIDAFVAGIVETLELEE